MTVAVDLRALRRNRGLLLREVAEQVQVSEAAMSYYERGSRRPLPPVAKRIADFYDLQVTDVWPEPECEAA